MVSKIVARCHILKLRVKCTKFDFRFKGPTSKEGRGGRTGGESKGQGKSEGRGPTSKARVRGKEGERGMTGLAPTNLKTRLHPWPYLTLTPT